MVRNSPFSESCDVGRRISLVLVATLQLDWRGRGQNHLHYDRNVALESAV